MLLGNGNVNAVRVWIRSIHLYYMCGSSRVVAGTEADGQNALKTGELLTLQKITDRYRKRRGPKVQLIAARSGGSATRKVISASMRPMRSHGGPMW
jgi:hypothetical protein